MINRRNTYRCLFVVIITINILFPFIPSGRSQGTPALIFTDTLTRDDETVVRDGEWQWYKCDVNIGLSAVVNLSYIGDLDVDLRLYWKRNCFPEFNGFDLSHCSLNDTTRYNYSDNSQFRTTNTYLLGQYEEIYFSNPSYTQLADQEAYILVFVYSGKGNSTYIIQSTLNMIKLEDNDVYDCNQVFTTYIIYSTIGVIMFTSSAILIKRKKTKLTRSQKVKKKRDSLPKEEKVIDLDSEYKGFKKEKDTKK